jgi:hypothetical protein
MKCVLSMKLLALIIGRKTPGSFNNCPDSFDTFERRIQNYGNVGWPR